MGLSVISLYTGIGGLDFGFEAAGFKTRVAVEMNSVACATMRLNRRWSVLEEDINQITSRQILKAAELRSGEADVLIGGPPCQPFSKSSYWVRGDALRLDDPRANTLSAYLRVLRDTKPRAFLLENVHGLAFSGKDEGLQLLLKGIADINAEKRTNYSVAVKKLNAAEYGVPQLRERVFLIGFRDGRKFTFPEPTHAASRSEGDLLSAGLEPYHTAWDAIGDLPAPSAAEAETLEVTGRWAGLLPTIPEGYNYLWHTNRGGGERLFGWRTRYWSFMLKLAKRLPSWTIQAQPGPSIGPFHWKNRRLSCAELARLQTFPDGLRVNAGRTEMQRMLGNAVPGLLAEVLAREIKQQLTGRNPGGAPQLMPKRAKSVPPAEKAAGVPAKYRSLIGEHADHPGEGRGRRATAVEREADVA